MNNIILSIILCSKNDSYMGNTKWRLETSINLTLLNAKESNWLEKIEILVCDWGSEEPLQKVLSLVPEAENTVKFLNVPPEVAKTEQKDSKFAEVIALNAVARQARGTYIGRIDNDTIIGKEFYTNFWHVMNDKFKIDTEDAFMFVERRMVPYRVSNKSWALNNIRSYINWFGQYLKVETAVEWGKEFWWSPVGIMIFTNKIWKDTHGYDQRFLYWGWMEGDLALRLGQKHQVVEFSKHIGHYFYHLEHYPSMTAYKDRNGPATPRKKNEPVFEGLNYTVNDKNWGLKNYELKLLSYSINEVSEYKSPTISSGIFEFLPELIISIFQRKIDNLRMSWRDDLKKITVHIKIFIGKYKRFLLEKIIQ